MPFFILHEVGWTPLQALLETLNSESALEMLRLGHGGAGRDGAVGNLDDVDVC